ncbi:MAG: hypothetical protein JWQ48_1884 [Conexibacter sp.]|nr:hypothetical protein [Conexibacter sp.]
MTARLRLTVAFAGLMALVLFLAGVFVQERLRSSLDGAIGRALHARVADVAALAQQSDSGLRDAGRTGLATSHGTSAQLIDARGRVIDETAGLGGRPLASPALLAQLRRDGAAHAASGRLDGEPLRLLAAPVRAQDQRLTIVVGQSLEDRNRALAQLTGVLLLGGPLALALAALAGFLVTGAALRPVETMRRRERAFVSDASHELRTPLALLRTELELIARERPAGAALRHAVGSAVEETDRLARLADDLLLLARAEDARLALRPDATPARTLLEDAATRARRAAPEASITVRDDGDAIVRADPERVAQALDNLLENALRHGRGGAVELRAEPREEVVELHVLDEGPGFPAHFLPLAWDRFARADAARAEGGTGLGMAIVRTIAELHGGEARAANRHEGGADVWIALPRGQAPGRLSAGRRAPGRRRRRALPY